MSNTIIVTLMTSLISKQFYATKDEAVPKLDVYYAMNRIGEEDYTKLVMLADSAYNPPEIIDDENVAK